MISNTDKDLLNQYYFYYIWRLFMKIGNKPKNKAAVKTLLVKKYIAESSPHLHTTNTAVVISQYITDTVLTDTGFIDFKSTF